MNIVIIINCNKLLELFATMPAYSYNENWFRTLGRCSYSSIAQSFQMMREKSYISSLILPTCSNISLQNFYELKACHGMHVGTI